MYKRQAFALATKEDFDWDSIFDGATWFHFSGITPAISDNMAEITIEACKEAKKRGITVSCDLNDRSKLWSSEKANKVMSEVCRYVDICIANEDDAVGIFGMDASKSDKEKKMCIRDSCGSEIWDMDVPYRTVAATAVIHIKSLRNIQP